jgi:DNA-binding CsgD family transcriptional regulator
MANSGHSPDGSYAFGVVGLSPLEEQAYRLLLRRRSATPAQLGEELGLTPRETAEACEALERKGFASRTTGTETHLLAAPPSAAVDVVALQLERQVQQARVAAARLADEWAAAADGRRVEELVQIVTGAEAMAHRFELLLAGAQHEILGFVAQPLLVADQINVDANVQALGRGVRSRTIYERALFDIPRVADLVAQCEAAGEKAGVVEALPSKMILVDRTIALLPVNLDVPGVEPSAALVHAPLTDSLVALFEELWRRAVPLALTDDASGARPRPEAPNGEDRRLLSLLVGGLSDDAVGRQLGLSRRTVHRRLQRLMAAAGVDSRLQLVWWATSAGWLPASNRAGTGGRQRHHAGTAGPMGPPGTKHDDVARWRPTASGARLEGRLECVHGGGPFSHGEPAQ